MSVSSKSISTGWAIDGPFPTISLTLSRFFYTDLLCLNCFRNYSATNRTRMPKSSVLMSPKFLPSTSSFATSPTTNFADGQIFSGSGFRTTSKRFLPRSQPRKSKLKPPRTLSLPSACMRKPKSYARSAMSKWSKCSWRFCQRHLLW